MSEELLQEAIAPPVSVKLGGKEYQLAFSMLSAIKFQEKTGKDLFSLEWKTDARRADISVALLWAALIHYQPDMSFEQAARLVSPKNQVEAASAVAQAWNNCMPEPSPNAAGQPNP